MAAKHNIRTLAKECEQKDLVVNTEGIRRKDKVYYSCKCKKCGSSYEWQPYQIVDVLEGTKLPCINCYRPIQDMNRKRGRAEDNPITDPILIKEYSPKNPLSIKFISKRSADRIIWNCSRNQDHPEWIQCPANRCHPTQPCGCPTCRSENKALKERLAAPLDDYLIKSYEKTGKNSVPLSILKKPTPAWWACDVCTDEPFWQTDLTTMIIVQSRRRRGKGGIADKCLCFIYKDVLNNRQKAKANLETHFPRHLYEQYSKSNERDLDTFSLGSNTKVWWTCPVNPEHEDWKATIVGRAKYGNNCPKCNVRLRSQQETFLFIKNTYSDALWEYKLSRSRSGPGRRLALDVYIPSINVGIEFDSPWHDNKGQRHNDIRKQEICKERQIRLIRFRWEDYVKNPHFVLESVLDNVKHGEKPVSFLCFGEPLDVKNAKKIAKMKGDEYVCWMEWSKDFD